MNIGPALITLCKNCSLEFPREKLISEAVANGYVVTEKIVIEIPGAPVPSPRKRASIRRTRKGPRVHVYTPEKGASYAERVALFAGIAAQKGGWKVEEKAAYRVEFEIYRATLRGDFDNFEKALTDPMNGIIWKDDSQITEWSGKLLLDRKNPRAIVRVERRVG